MHGPPIRSGMPQPEPLPPIPDFEDDDDDLVLKAPIERTPVVSTPGSVEFEKRSVERERKSLEKEWKTIEKEWKSLERERKSIERSRKSVELGRNVPPPPGSVELEGPAREKANKKRLPIGNKALKPHGPISSPASVEQAPVHVQAPETKRSDSPITRRSLAAAPADQSVMESPTVSTAIVWGARALFAVGCLVPLTFLSSYVLIGVAMAMIFGIAVYCESVLRK